MSQDCGGCRHFRKCGDAGLCELHDARTSTDRGRRCADFKAPKHTRQGGKQAARAELYVEDSACIADWKFEDWEERFLDALYAEPR